MVLLRCTADCATCLCSAQYAYNTNNLKEAGISDKCYSAGVQPSLSSAMIKALEGPGCQLDAVELVGRCPWIAAPAARKSGAGHLAIAGAPLAALGAALLLAALL